MFLVKLQDAVYFFHSNYFMEPLLKKADESG